MKQDLAACLDISVQAVRNKFTRDSFSVNDLIRIAKQLDCELLFKVNDSQIIELSQEDLKSLDDYFRVGFTYSSNALEGNTLTVSETKIIPEDGLTVGGAR